MKQYFSVLQTSPLFRGIEAQEFTELFDCMGASVRRYAKNERIFREGAPVSAVGVVLCGHIQIVQEDIYGNRSILATAEPGDLFGEAFVCAELEQIPVSVDAISNADILFLNYQKIVTACPKSCRFHHQLIKNMMTILARKNILLNGKLELLSKRTTREKLLSYLSREAQRAGSLQFTIPFKRQELADFLCVERSAMSCELGRMRDEGLLRFSRCYFELIPQA